MDPKASVLPTTPQRLTTLQAAPDTWKAISWKQTKASPHGNFPEKVVTAVLPVFSFTHAYIVRESGNTATSASL